MSETTPPLSVTLDQVFRSTRAGSRNDSIGNVFWGINHQITPEPIPQHRSAYGLTFFTRPQLNLSTQNVRAVRQLLPLLDQRPDSIQRIIRSYLDPRLAYQEPKIACDHVDQHFPFIAILSNHLVTCSGWPDRSLGTYTSKPGLYKEVYSQVDDTHHQYGPYTLNATFRNMIGSPIIKLFDVWAIYKGSVFDGSMTPYIDMITENEVDYYTRPYSLQLDPSRRFVQDICCAGYAYPTNVPIGNIFDIDRDKPFNAANDQIQIPFQAVGLCYNDPIIIHEFNAVVEIFNPTMRERYRQQQMVQIPFGDLALFNGRGYPHIDPDTKELQWWVVEDEYRRVAQDYVAYHQALRPLGQASALENQAHGLPLSRDGFRRF